MKLSDEDLEFEKQNLLQQRRVLVRRIDALDTELIAIREAARSRKEESAWREQLVGKSLLE